MRAHLHGMTVDGQWKPIIIGEAFTGGGLVGGNAAGASSASPLVNGWSYAAASGGIEDTADVAIKAAAGAKRYNYLNGLQLMNRDASVGTEVVIKDGSTVLWRTYLAPVLTGSAPVPISVSFNPPLVGSNNTALNVACITTSAQVYVNAQGFVSGPPNQAELNNNSLEEVFNRTGDLVTDRAGSTITLRSN
jgi:hypothetical protein